MLDILDILHSIIDNQPDVQILRLRRDQAQAFYDYLCKYHINTAPASFEDMLAKGKLQFLGRKIEVYEQSEV